LPVCLVLVNKLSSIFGWLRLRLAVSAKPCSPAGKSDYQPVGLRFAWLPALSSLNQKRNLISLPVLICHNYKTIGRGNASFGLILSCGSFVRLCGPACRGKPMLRQGFAVQAGKKSVSRITSPWRRPPTEKQVS